MAFLMLGGAIQDILFNSIANPAGDKLFFKTDEIFPVKKIELLDVMGRVTMGLQPADRYPYLPRADNRN